MDTFVYTPLYNILLLIIDAVPGLDLGIYIILFTIVVKLILMPFAIRGIKAQQALKRLEPQLKALQEEYKDDRQQLGVKMMELYREHNVNPFSSFGLILVQIPIIFGLYYIVLRSGLPDIDPSRLYDFVRVPETNPSPLFLGALDVISRSLPLALAAGVTQFIQTRVSVLGTATDSENQTPQQQIMQSVMKQVQFIFPILITVIAYTLSAAVALYFITSNIFHIAQEYYVRYRGFKNTENTDRDKDVLAENK